MGHRFSIGTSERSHSRRSLASRLILRSRPTAVRGGGVPAVVRGRESRPHVIADSISASALAAPVGPHDPEHGEAAHRPRRLGAVPAAAALRRHQGAAARARESPDHPVGAGSGQKIRPRISLRKPESSSFARLAQTTKEMPAIQARVSRRSLRPDARVGDASDAPSYGEQPERPITSATSAQRVSGSLMRRLS